MMSQGSANQGFTARALIAPRRDADPRTHAKQHACLAASASECKIALPD